MDFPTAWAISRSVPPEEHNPRCSTAQTNGGMLCDCEVLTQHPQYLADYGDGKAPPMTPSEHAATFHTADQSQKAALAEVSRQADVKMRAVLAMRDAGLSLAEIGSLVGLTVAGVHRIAAKGKDRT